MHTWVSDLNLPAVRQVDDRRIEVIAHGLPLYNGSQLAIDTTLAPPSQVLQCGRFGRPGPNHDAAGVKHPRRLGPGGLAVRFSCRN